MNKLSRIFRLTRYVMALFCCMAASTAAGAREWLIKDASQLSTNGINPSTVHCLLDNNRETFYGSGEEASDLHYIQVDLGAPLALADDEDIVIYTQRFNGAANPTAFRIYGSNDAANWENVAHAYFVYRGSYTKEYSARIHPSKNFRYFRDRKSVV